MGAIDPPDGHLDPFMPAYDVIEQHRVRVRAPADLVLRVAGEIAIEDSRVIRGIIRAREIVLGAPGSARSHLGLLDQVRALGWGQLAEEPGRELIFGAVTKPWEPQVTFRPLAPEAFAAFDEPGFVKIVWTLRADPIGPQASVFRTETRAVATDDEARRRFRWYWRRFSPGIILIRRIMLRMLKRRAEGVAAGAAA